MERNLRKTGIDVLGDISWGTYFCQFYETKEDLLKLLVPYFKTGLENNEYCVWIGSNPFNIEKVLMQLRRSIPLFDEFLSRKSFEIIPVTEWYLKDGRYNATETLNKWNLKLSNAFERGHEGMRIHDYKGWLDHEDWKIFVQYEKELVKIISNSRIILMSSYPIAKSDASMLLDVMQLHGRIISTRNGNVKILEEAEIRSMKEELQTRNTELEKQVQRRTQELETIVRELESEVAARKQAEERAKSEKDVCRLITESFPGVFKIIDENYKIVAWNQMFEAFTGYTSQEIPNLHAVNDLYNGEERKKINELIRKTFDEGVLNDEVDLTMKNGRTARFYFIGRQINYEDKNCIIFCGVDMTERKEAEERLIKEKELSNQVLDSIPGIVTVADENLRYVRWNKNFEAIAGNSARGNRIMHIGDFAADENARQTVREFFQEIFLNKRTTGELSVMLKNGDQITFHVTGRKIDYEGKPCVLAISVDITERKKMEEQLRYEKNLSNEIIDSIPGLFALFNENMRFIRWNKNFEMVSGYTPEEIGKLHGIESFFDNEKDKKRTAGILAEIFEKGNGSAEVSPLMKDGNPVHLFFTGRSFKYNNQTYLITTGIDVSELKKAEEELRLADRRLSYHVENTPLAVIEWDKNLVITRWSGQAEKIFGWSSSEVLGKNINDPEFALIYKEDKPHVDKIAYELANGLVDRNMSLNRNYTKDGKMIYCEWYNSALKDRSGNVITVLSLAHDITERQEAEEATHQSYQQIRQLTTHLQNVREEERAHIARELHDELGQLITVLKMDVSWLSKKLINGEAVVKEKLHELNQLLDSTVQSVRRISFELRPSILDDLGLAAAMEWHLKEFEKRSGIKTFFNEPEEEPSLSNPVKTSLYRIFQESLTNVARHSSASELRVDIRKTDGELMLSIKDNGQGFDIKKASEKRTLGILGMKERAAMMGGNYEIKTEEGKGTTVTVLLPLTT